MKLMSYLIGGRLSLGAVLGADVIDLAAAAQWAGLTPLPGSARELLAGGRPALDAARRAVELLALADHATTPGLRTPLSEVTVLPPVPNPSKIVCVGRNYAAHAEEIGVDRPERAIFFTRFPQTLVAHEAAVWLPRASPELDWEGELAVVIGTKCRHVPAADAYDVVAGYSIFNDVSVRDFQRRTPQYTAGKNFDSTAPFGPFLVTADEVADPHDLYLSTFVGEERMQHASTAEMLFSIPELIEDISEWTTLLPGDVIATGSPAGVGGLRTPPRFLKAGERVSVHITGLGTLSNPVVNEP